MIMVNKDLYGDGALYFKSWGDSRTADYKIVAWGTLVRPWGTLVGGDLQILQVVARSSLGRGVLVCLGRALVGKGRFTNGGDIN